MPASSDNNSERLREENAELHRYVEELEERLRRETELSRRERERANAIYRELFENMNAGVIVLSPMLDGEDFRVLDINPHAQKIEFRSRSDLVGSTLTESYPGVIGSKLLEAIRRVARGGRSEHHVEYRAAAPSGEIVLDCSIFPITSGRIIVVFRDVTDWERSEQALRASIEEKESLLREIHHRVKNNLQIVNSLFSLQENELANGRDREAFRKSRNRIRSIALIHEELYAGAGLGRIDARDYIEKLAGSVAIAFEERTRNIMIDTVADDVGLEIDTAVPIGLILTELISNCFQYAFPGDVPGTVRISVRKRSEFISIDVEDNGVGLPPGIDPMTTPGLGFQLTVALVDQLRGKLSIGNVVDHGTSVEITFPQA